MHEVKRRRRRVNKKNVIYIPLHGKCEECELRKAGK